MRAWRRVGAGVLLGAVSVAAIGQAPAGRGRGTSENAAEGKIDKEEAAVPIPPETTSVIKHSLTVEGKAIAYTATAGDLLIRDETGKANASIFYAAYTEDGADVKNRPVTFFTTGDRGRRRSGCTWGRLGRCG